MEQSAYMNSWANRSQKRMTEIEKIKETIKLCKETPACNKTWIQIQNEPLKAMRKQNLYLAASRHIRDDTGLTIYSVTGNQQAGKSAYCMCVLAELYNYDEDEIMKHIVMSAKEFTDIIDDALTNGYRHKCILWDDMSVTGGAAKWMTDPKMVMYLGALGDTLGVATKSIMLSSPSGDMVKAFRNYHKYIVQIHKGQNKYDRTAKAYFIGRSPMMQRYCSPVFEDAFDTRIPFYERYAKKRKDISIKAVRDMKQLNSEQEQQEKAPKITMKERILELKRDVEAGVFGEVSFKHACKMNKIDYGYACHVV